MKTPVSHLCPWPYLVSGYSWLLVLGFQRKYSITCCSIPLWKWERMVASLLFPISTGTWRHLAAKVRHLRWHGLRQRSITWQTARGNTERHLRCYLARRWFRLRFRLGTFTCFWISEAEAAVAHTNITFNIILFFKVCWLFCRTGQWPCRRRLHAAVGKRSGIRAVHDVPRKPWAVIVSTSQG